MVPTSTTGNDFTHLFSALKTGLMDGGNACNLATVLIFIILCSCFGTTPKKILSVGIVFILAAVSVQYLSAMGAWDGFMTQPSTGFLIRYGYTVLIIVFLVLSVLNGTDWWRYKKHRTVRKLTLYAPVFFRLENQSEIQKGKFTVVLFIGLLAVSLAVSVVTVLMSVIYPQSMYIFIVHSFLMAGKNLKFAHAACFLYSLSMNVPLITAWFILLWLSIKQKSDPKAVVYYKGVSSVLFFAAAVGLGFYFSQLN